MSRSNLDKHHCFKSSQHLRPVYHEIPFPFEQLETSSHVHDESPLVPSSAVADQLLGGMGTFAAIAKKVVVVVRTQLQCQ